MKIVEPGVHWQNGSRGAWKRLDASIVHAEIEKIAEKNGGVATAEDVVSAARKRSSPIHSCFTWDDTEAAKKWRNHQARLMVGAIKIVDKEGAPGRPAHVAVTITDGARGYIDASVAASNPDLREQMLADAKRYLVGFRTRFAQLKELASVFEAIDEL